MVQFLRITFLYFAEASLSNIRDVGFTGSVGGGGWQARPPREVQNPPGGLGGGGGAGVAAGVRVAG